MSVKITGNSIIEVSNGDWTAKADIHTELGVEGWRVYIFFRDAIAYRGFLLELYKPEAVAKAIQDYIAKAIEEDEKRQKQ